jgi:succinate dehydrogenase/fumarate reductase flavoprotein subunit
MANIDIVAVLEKNAKAKGVDIRYLSPAAQLVREGKGRITGVIAGKKDNYTKFVAKKGVILCAGDYGSNKEMLAKYCPLALKTDLNSYFPEPVNVGEGHQMGLWAGAAMQKAEPHAAMIHCHQSTSTYCFLQINKHGKRFHNEDIVGMAVGLSQMFQPDKLVWSIADDNRLEVIPKTLELGGGVFWDQLGRTVGSPWDREAEKMSLEELEKSGVIVKANTLDELAAMIQVPVETFKATVARYNELVKTGKDEDFGMRPQLLFPIEKPPFYAGRIHSALLVMTGGLSINSQMQVLDTEDNPIPGLYAAGNNSGDFWGIDYPMVFPGHSHGRCLTFGRLAGQNAAKETV